MSWLKTDSDAGLGVGRVYLRAGVAWVMLMLVAVVAFGGSIFDDDWVSPSKGERTTVQPPAKKPVLPEVKPVTPDVKPETRPDGVEPDVLVVKGKDPVVAPVRPARMAIPAKEAQAASRKLMKDVFSKQLKDQTKAGRQKLVQDLLNEAPKLADSPADRFVVIAGAMDAAREVADVKGCVAAADLMAVNYEVDGLDVKREALLKMPQMAYASEKADENVRAGLEVAGELLSEGELAPAAKLLAMMQQAQVKDAGLKASVVKQAREIEAIKAAEVKIAPHLATLKTSPDDGPANLAVGSYWCFTRGDWERGLPMLAKGSDGGMKALAQEELGRPASVDDVVKLADGWWDSVAKQSDNASRVAVMSHAGALYVGALDKVTGLRRVQIEKRVADAAQVEGANPFGAANAVFTNSLGMKFVRIKPGEFMMGTPAEEAGRKDDEAQHRVRMSRPFFLQSTEVTQGQWKAVMGDNPSAFKGDDLPVDSVSWDEAVTFCAKLTSKDGRKYRLPTEAEWEYACRAGTTSIFYFGDTISREQANYNSSLTYGRGARGTYREKTTAVGSLPANTWGLYDMHGNVWEWCADGYGPYSKDALTIDPIRLNNRGLHVLRGGSWCNDPVHLRAGFRDTHESDYRNNTLGLRVAVDLR